MTHKHTPGEWVFNEHSVWSEGDNRPNGNIICDAPKVWADSYNYWPANSKLISAAPDMLTLIEEIVEILEVDKEMRGLTPLEEHMYKKFNQVIKKATE